MPAKYPHKPSFVPLQMGAYVAVSGQASKFQDADLGLVPVHPAVIDNAKRLPPEAEIVEWRVF